MKLKYYLRGAGIALMLAVLLTNVSHKNEVSAYADTSKQEEIDASVDEDNLVVTETPDTEKPLEKVENVVEDNTETVYMAETQSAITPEEESVDENVIPEQQEEIKTVDEQMIEENTDTEYETEQNVADEKQEQVTDVLVIDESAQETFLLNIVRGDDSGTVSRKLYNAGLIDSASQFDAYLMQHGYDKKIKVGTVEVPIGATWLEIAEKLAGK